MKDTSPLISVIVPIYNTEKYLRRCIDSILAQTFSDFELILVNDGSRDSSGAICDEYDDRDERVVVIHQENSGVSVARNHGMEVAKGKYISFVDSDDWVEVDYLDSFAKEVYEHSCPDLIMQRITVHINQLEAREYSFEESLGGPCVKLFRNQVIRDNGIHFIPNLKFNEDSLFIFDFLKRCRSIQHVDKTRYHYVKNDSSASALTQRDFSEFLKALTIWLDNLKDRDSLEPLIIQYAQDRTKFIFYKLVLALYNNPTSKIQDRIAVLRSLFSEYPDSIEYFPMLYGTDRLIVWCLSHKLYYCADIINITIWNYRNNKI